MTIELAGLVVFGNHGYFEEERRLGQRFLVDLRVDVSGEATASDRIEDTVDYRSIAEFTRLYFGRSVLDSWVEPFVADASLCDPDSASRVLFLLHYVARRYAPVGTLRSGLADLAQALAPDDATRLGAIVHALEPVGERIAVRLAEPDGERSVDTDAVVLATPAVAARAIADPLLQTAERDFFARARCAAAIVMAVALDRAVVGCATRTRVPDGEGWPVATVAIQPGGGAGAPAP